MRVCSLLPSATEIVFALGQGHTLVGVTHECDYPPEAARRTVVTRSNIPAGLSSHEIDAAVSAALVSTGSLYELDVAEIERLAPDLILTQRLCEVCAVSADRVEQALDRLPCRPRVVNLEPHSLRDILESVRTVGRLLGAGATETVAAGFERRVAAVDARTRQLADRPRVVCLEWVSPPFCGGHWMAELVDLAGGRDGLARRGEPSRRLAWAEVRKYAPEVLVLTCCGFPLERCLAEAEILQTFEGFAELPAARAGRIYATDGSAYFSRPGPRIVESLEILAHLVHPELFVAPPLPRAYAPALTEAASAARAAR